MLPDTVLFGLIFVNFLPPIVLPITYPPMSEKKHIDITKRKTTGLPALP